MAERVIRVVIDPSGAETGGRRVTSAINRIDREVRELGTRLRSGLALDSRGIVSGSQSASRALGRVDREVDDLRGNLGRGVVLDSRGFVVSSTRVENAVKGIDREVDQLQANLAQTRLPRGVAGGASNATSAFSRLSGTVAAVSGALASLAVGTVAIRGLVRYADTWRLTTNRLKVVTSSSEELLSVQGQLLEVAAETFSVYQPTVDLYSRLARSTRELGISQERVLNVTRTVNQAIAVGGSTSVEATAGIIQFGQALASGALRGDELRSVLEQMPRLAIALAEGLGVTIGGLRTLGEAGELTTTVILGALERSAPSIAAEFEQLTPTIGVALAILSDGLLQSVGRLDEASGASARFSQQAIDLASALRGLTKGEIEGIEELLDIFTRDPIAEGIDSFFSRFSANTEAAGQANQTALDRQLATRDRLRDIAGAPPREESSTAELRRIEIITTAYQHQADAVGLTRSESDLLRAQRAGATGFQLLEIEANAELVESYDKEQAALKEIRREKEANQESDERIVESLRNRLEVQQAVTVGEREAIAVARLSPEATAAQRQEVARLVRQSIELTEARREQAIADREANREAREAERVLSQQSRADERLIESLEARRNALLATTREQRVSLQVARLSINAGNEQREQTAGLTAEIEMLERAIRDKRDADREAARAAREAERDAQRFAESLASNITSGFEDAILAGRGWGAVLGRLGEDIARLIIRITVLKPLADSLIAVFNRGGGGGGAGGGFLSSFLSGLVGGFGGGGGGNQAPIGGPVSPGGGGFGNPFAGSIGFQQGGAFTVPGSGGPDSRDVFFRATPGERVSIETPSQQRSGVSVTVNNFAASDVGVQVEETAGPSGEVLLDVMVARSINRQARTGQLDGVFSGFGASRNLVSR